MRKTIILLLLAGILPATSQAYTINLNLPVNPNLQVIQDTSQWILQQLDQMSQNVRNFRLWLGINNPDLLSTLLLVVLGVTLIFFHLAGVNYGGQMVEAFYFLLKAVVIITVFYLLIAYIT